MRDFEGIVPPYSIGAPNRGGGSGGGSEEDNFIPPEQTPVESDGNWIQDGRFAFSVIDAGEPEFGEQLIQNGRFSFSAIDAGEPEFGKQLIQNGRFHWSVGEDKIASRQARTEKAKVDWSLS